MQAQIQAPLGGLRLHTPQETSCSRVTSYAAQGQYYIAQQRMSNQHNNQLSHGLRNGLSSSHPDSSSSHLQSRQMHHAWFTKSQDQLLRRNAASASAISSNGHFGPFPAAQHGPPCQNLSHHPQALNSNTVSQQNFNMPPLHNMRSNTASWFPPVFTNASFPVENNLTYQSVLGQCQSGHNRMPIAHQPAAQPQQTDLPVQSNQAQNIHNNQGQIKGNANGALYSSVSHHPSTSQKPSTVSQTSNNHQTAWSHLSYDRGQVQHSSPIHHQTSPCRMVTTPATYSNFKYSGSKCQILPHKSPPASNTIHRFSIQHQQNPGTNNSSALSVSLENVQPQTQLKQCNTIPVSGHHIVPAGQGNIQQQNLQLNNPVTVLPRYSQMTSSTHTNKAPPPSYAESIFKQPQVTSVDLLLEKNDAQVPAQSHGTSPHSSFQPSFNIQEQTPSHITKASHSQTAESVIQRVGECQTVVKERLILKDNENVLGDQLKGPNVQGSEEIQSRGVEIESNVDQQKDVHKKKHEAVQNTEDTSESLELVMPKVPMQSHNTVTVDPPIFQQIPRTEKNDHVATSSDNNLPFKVDSHALNLTKRTIEELQQLFLAPHHKTQEHKLQDGFTVDNLIPNKQSSDIPQSEIGSKTSQGSVCFTVMATKSPEDHNKVETGNSDGGIFDLSKVQVLNFTLEQFKYWVKYLENTPEGRVKKPVADVQKCLLDLYWDGSGKHFIKCKSILKDEMIGLYSKVSVSEMKRAMFQYLQPADLKMLACGYHILKHDTDLQTEEFRSSWLNIDGQPADIENVLADPVLDFPDFNTLKSSSAFEPSTKELPVTTARQNDKINNKPANIQVCESKSTDNISNTQEASKKKDENPEKHQPDVTISPEKSEDSLMENESKTEQVCRDASRDIDSSKIAEQKDLFNGDDSSNDPILIKLLSSDEAKAFFKEHPDGAMKEEPSQLSQIETKILTAPDKNSNVKFNPANQITFTCPHVTEVDCDGENFCPKCWEDTPLLDLEEALFSFSKDSSPVMSTPIKQGQHTQSCPLSGIPDAVCIILSESSSIIESPTPELEEKVSEPDGNPNDAVESNSSPSEKLPVKELFTALSPERVGFSLPNEVGKSNNSVGPELRNSISFAQNIENVVLEQNNYKDPLPKGPPCKKLKLTKTTERPFIQTQPKQSRRSVSPKRDPPSKKIKITKFIAKPTDNDLFTPDIVVTKAQNIFSKPHLSGLSISRIENNQHLKHKRKPKESKHHRHNRHSSQNNTDAYGKWNKPSVKSKVSNVPKASQPKRPAVEENTDKNNETVLSKTRPTGQNIEIKKLKCALYGFKNNKQNRFFQYRCCSNKSMSKVPVCVTISAGSKTDNSYTDTPSAKQKVYSKWSSTFVEPKRNPFKRKRQK